MTHQRTEARNHFL